MGSREAGTYLGEMYLSGQGVALNQPSRLLCCRNPPMRAIRRPSSISD